MHRQHLSEFVSVHPHSHQSYLVIHGQDSGWIGSQLLSNPPAEGVGRRLVRSQNVVVIGGDGWFRDDRGTISRTQGFQDVFQIALGQIQPSSFDGQQLMAFWRYAAMLSDQLLRQTAKLLDGWRALGNSVCLGIRLSDGRWTGTRFRRPGERRRSDSFGIRLLTAAVRLNFVEIGSDAVRRQVVPSYGSNHSAHDQLLQLVRHLPAGHSHIGRHRCHRLQRSPLKLTVLQDDGRGLFQEFLDAPLVGLCRRTQWCFSRRH